MSKSRPFSIYLLKPEYDSVNALIEDHHLTQEQARSTPTGGTLLVSEGEPSDPWWKPYFGVQKQLKQISQSALLFLPVDDRCFALSFGHAHHKLKDESFEYDFGLRVTLNCVDPDELKSTDTLDPGAARRRRTQLPIGSDLTYFDFDRNSAILKSLTGKVLPQYQDMFGSVTGSSSLTIRSTIAPGEMIAFCRKLRGLYDSQNYRTAFPDIGNIAPVKDPVVLDWLRTKLIEAMRNRSESVYLTVPDMIDYREVGSLASFAGMGTSLQHQDIYINKYYEYLESHGLTLAQLEYDQVASHALILTDEDSARKKRHSLINCLIFDTALDTQTQTYHLTEGKWYRVENAYIAKLTAALDPLCQEIAFPDFAHDDEGHYNEAVALEVAGFVCLDEANIAPKGQTAVEPCDLYSVDAGFAVLHHIKRSTVSAKLSHLFSQGDNAIELIKLEEVCLGKLCGLITAQLDPALHDTFLQPLRAKRLRVVFGIITHKDNQRKSENLPLFSRISLVRTARSLQLKDAGCHFGFITDASVPKTGIAKKRKARTVAAVASQAT